VGTGLGTSTEERTGETTDLAPPYNVFLWNDPVTPMVVVTRALKRIFCYDHDRAELLMITAHLEGKVVVWTGERERAQRYCVELGLSGLQSTVGRAS
jgi:ATP-dependent Clp protease adaptor protein ClpS